jgi:hypothetical protein
MPGCFVYPIPVLPFIAAGSSHSKSSNGNVCCCKSGFGIFPEITDQHYFIKGESHLASGFFVDYSLLEAELHPRQKFNLTILLYKTKY